MAVFSACGGMYRYTARKDCMTVLTAYFQGIPLVQFRVSWARLDCLNELTGSSTQARTGCTDLQLVGSSVADCLALTWRFVNHLFNAYVICFTEKCN